MFFALILTEKNSFNLKNLTIFAFPILIFLYSYAIFLDVWLLFLTVCFRFGVRFCAVEVLRKKASHTDMCYTTCTRLEPHGEGAGALLQEWSVSTEWALRSGTLSLVSQDTAALSAPSQSVLVQFPCRLQTQNSCFFASKSHIWFTVWTVESVEVSLGQTYGWILLLNRHFIGYLF